MLHQRLKKKDLCESFIPSSEVDKLLQQESKRSHEQGQLFAYKDVLKEANLIFEHDVTDREMFNELRQYIYDKIKEVKK